VRRERLHSQDNEIENYAKSRIASFAAGFFFVMFYGSANLLADGTTPPYKKRNHINEQQVFCMVHNPTHLPINFIINGSANLLADRTTPQKKQNHHCTL
jgi:adenosine/AMP kinase